MVSFTRRVRIAAAGFGVLHTTQLIGHAARLLYSVDQNVTEYKRSHKTI